MARKGSEKLQAVEAIAGEEIRAALKLCAGYRRTLEWSLKKAKAEQREFDRLVKAGERPRKQPGGAQKLAFAFRAYNTAVVMLAKECREQQAALRKDFAAEDTQELQGKLLEGFHEVFELLSERQRAAMMAHMEAAVARTEH